MIYTKVKVQDPQSPNPQNPFNCKSSFPCSSHIKPYPSRLHITCPLCPYPVNTPCIFISSFLGSFCSQKEEKKRKTLYRSMLGPIEHSIPYAPRIYQHSTVQSKQNIPVPSISIPPKDQQKPR